MTSQTPPSVLFSPNSLDLTDLKSALNDFNQAQKDAFLKGAQVRSLIYERAAYMDALLISLWRHYQLDKNEELALIAVGGYGRQELHPLSDIDLLVLIQKGMDETQQPFFSAFINLLWDLKLEVGHSVRTLDECIEMGLSDLSVATSLQETRLLCGKQAQYDLLTQRLQASDFWPSSAFYTAKLEEQKKRHARYHNTAYNLEPDIKLSPGGLRDIHTLRWIAARHLGTSELQEMSKQGFLTHGEYKELDECQTRLWQIRYALHLELRRYDNRLTFAYQAKVAEMLGYTGKANQGVERMMKDFYRTLGRVSELNKMLLRLFDQAINKNNAKTKTIPLSDDFQRKGKQIEARKPALFQARPDTLLTLFLHIANDKSIRSISAPTLRQLRTARRRLNRYLCEIPSAKEQFMALLRHPNALHKAFPLMHKHGVLAAYFPAWSHIVGQMQFDLFHAYTVDEHTMRLLAHIEGFSFEENRDNHPICYDINAKLAKPELLRLAAIFHDIGKGQGGDHSKIGAEIAHSFCLLHELSTSEANLVAWLVENHLLMSVTAQKKDIYDADVIREFAEMIKDEEHLDLLICLTVADIKATNPELWNSWKRTLLTELYYSTQKMLRLGLENPPDLRARIRHNQHLAAAILRRKNHAPYEINRLWHRFKADYFLRHTHKQIAWHSHHLLGSELDKTHIGEINTNKINQKKSLVLVSKYATRGGTEIFIYSKDKPSLFARVVAALDRKNLSVHDAQITTSKDGFALDTFMVLDANGKAISNDRHAEITKGIEKSLQEIKLAPLPKRNAAQKLLAFKVKTQINFLPVRHNKHSRIEFICLDKPGLLAQVAKVFAQNAINLQSAKITTIGERAEDFFIVTNQKKQALSLLEQKALKEALLAALGS